MEALPVTKDCQHCGQTFFRNRRQNKGWWERAKFCSERCMQAARVPAETACPNCGTMFRQRHGKRLQTFCSIGCANMSRGVNPLTTRYQRMKAPDGKSKTAQRAMMEAHLGRTLAPEEIVHHADEQKLNNRLSNFRIMSISDHGRHHNPPINPVTSQCVMCGETFTPHKTKRGRKQTCSPDCKINLLKTRWREHHPRICANG